LNECVFFEYSNLHKGFKCLDAATGCIYISWDVTFDENIFPFSKLHLNAGAKLWSQVQLMPDLFPIVPSLSRCDITGNDPMTNDPPINPTVETCDPQEITGSSTDAYAQGDSTAARSTPEFVPGETPTCNPATTPESVVVHQEGNMRLAPVQDSTNSSPLHQARDTWVTPTLSSDPAAV
jgi:hypothetical protein